MCTNDGHMEYFEDSWNKRECINKNKGVNKALPQKQTLFTANF